MMIRTQQWRDLLESVEDDDVALVVIEVAGERPSTVARYRKVARSEVRTDGETELTDSSDRTISEIVPLQHIQAAVDGLAFRALRQKHDTGVGHVPIVCRQQEIDGLDQPALDPYLLQPGETAGLADEIDAPSVW